MKTILISGGGGYLGTHLTQVLLKKTKLLFMTNFFLSGYIKIKKK